MTRIWTEIVADQGGKPPSEFIVFAAGWLHAPHARKGGGRFLMDAEAARRVLRNFKQLGRDVVVDYEHQTILPEERSGGVAPAAGWIKALRWEEGRGLIATAEWTARGAELLAAREYRYHSPVFTTNQKDGRIESLSSVALTNDPATLNLAPIAARRAAGQHVTAAEDQAMTEFLRVLGLDPDATLDDVKAALNEENRAAAAQALGLPPETTIEEILAALEAAGLRSGSESGESGGGGGDGGGGPPESGVKRFGAYRQTVLAGAARRLNAELKLGLKGDCDMSQVTAAAKGRIESPPGSVSADEHKKVVDDLKSSNERIAKLEADAQQAEFQRVICSAEHAGKIAPAEQEKFFKLFKSDRDSFDAMLGKIPTVARGTSVFAGDKGGGKAAADDWDKNPELQREFGGNKAEYEAWKKADARGSARVMKTRD